MDKKIKYEGKFAMGSKVKDKITGFEGTITAVTFYLYGCTQYLVQPIAKDGEQKEPDFIDESGLELLAEPEIPKQPLREGGKRKHPKR